MSRVIVRTGAVLAVAFLAGCGSQTADGQSSPDSASTPTSARTPRHVDQSDRPPVSFDPCLDLPDDTLVAAGYDPTSETNADFTPDSYTFLGCSYDTQQRLYGLNILSGNIAFAEEREKTKGYSTPTEINGRPALLKWETNKPNACALSIETPYGVLILDRSVFQGHGVDAPEAEWCAGLEETARTFEPFIPKGD
ncbi:DUF3558 domain-containing protein [Rhodococcus koreensis]|jgi:hypothetical protein|uniref:DUF3558 domain-containing protein n=1 Tax=Rhodococcus koreensis TaxID=99653 RepID=UPI001980AFED|nr:DUF3558 domain-containing protein [Rhodococcus koreensis]QSE79863.1 DUF3558 domain-containing protein [Rhodococcus koreensis]